MAAAPVEALPEALRCPAGTFETPEQVELADELRVLHWLAVGGRIWLGTSRETGEPCAMLVTPLSFELARRFVEQDWLQPDGEIDHFFALTPAGQVHVRTGGAGSGEDGE